jgi:hypothetical protein
MDQRNSLCVFCDKNELLEILKGIFRDVPMFLPAWREAGCEIITLHFTGDQWCRIFLFWEQ